MNRREMIKILNHFKQFMGLKDYKVTIKKGYHHVDSGFAESEYSYLEKTVDIKLDKSFKKEPYERQRNILIHELIHARYGIFEEAKNVIGEDLEEEFVNDLTRGIEQLK